VLRVTPGQPVRIGIVDGPLGTGVVLAADDTSVALQCTFEATPARPKVDLLLALPRPKVMRRLWAQLAALGVSRVMLTNAARVERNYFDTHVLDAAVYRPLLLEGLQQARDTHLPVVSIHRQFRRLVEDELASASNADLSMVADPASEASPFTAIQPATRRVLLAIGPEGGWNRFELELLRSRGFIGVGIGPRTLRSDTACVALLAVMHEALRLRGSRHP
jgi:RsmE family RNA methyltransferase